ncbi:MAG: L-threonylcarbamoyladenylate synthase [Cytophagaceae bacterium]|nr:L-threonylcarbamoyladenylate synthase [Cytophagaceae bacterium]MDW8456232.1 L-threonylcarbamoyladenylate synthase [Cytophagaceae bacterium]
MPAEYLTIHPVNPEPGKIAKVASVLRDGGLVIYPTDTVYGMGCDIHNKRAVETLCKVNNLNPRKINLSFVCYDLSHISEYTRNISTQVFKAMKKCLPGPYTFILNANNKVPDLLHLHTRKNTVGIRVPDNTIAREIVRALEHPILNCSIKDEDEIVQYTTDPEEIYRQYKHKVDLIIDGGTGGNIPSSVLDCTGSSIIVVREGLGNVEEWL